jgi:hypothetical protein
MGKERPEPAAWQSCPKPESTNRRAWRSILDCIACTPHPGLGRQLAHLWSDELSGHPRARDAPHHPGLASTWSDATTRRYFASWKMMPSV